MTSHHRMIRIALAFSALQTGVSAGKPGNKNKGSKGISKGKRHHADQELYQQQQQLHAAASSGHAAGVSTDVKSQFPQMQQVPPALPQLHSHQVQHHRLPFPIIPINPGFDPGLIAAAAAQAGVSEESVMQELLRQQQYGGFIPASINQMAQIGILPMQHQQHAASLQKQRQGQHAKTTGHVVNTVPLAVMSLDGARVVPKSYEALLQKKTP